MLQLSSLDAEAKDISARHGLAPPELSQPQPGDSDDDDDVDAGDADGNGGPDVKAGLSAGGLEGEEEVVGEGKEAVSSEDRSEDRVEDRSEDRYCR